MILLVLFQFLEVVLSATLFEDLPVGLVAVLVPVQAEEEEEADVVGADEGEGYPADGIVEGCPGLDVLGCGFGDVDDDYLDEEDEGEDREEDDLQSESEDIPPFLDVGPGEDEPQDLHELYGDEGNYLSEPELVEDGEGEHHHELLDVGEDVVVMGSQPQLVDPPLPSVDSILVESDIFQVVAVLDDELLEPGVVQGNAGEVQEDVVDPHLVKEVVDVDDEADDDGGPFHS